MGSLLETPECLSRLLPNISKRSCCRIYKTFKIFLVSPSAFFLVLEITNLCQSLVLKNFVNLLSICFLLSLSSAIKNNSQLPKVAKDYRIEMALPLVTLVDKASGPSQLNLSNLIPIFSPLCRLSDISIFIREIKVLMGKLLLYKNSYLYFNSGLSPPKSDT